MKEYSRTQRIGQLIQQELAEIIQREVRNQQLGLLTLSSVEVSPDLQHARIYVTTLGGSFTPVQSIHYLNGIAGSLRHHLARRLTTRTTPHLRFLYDESIEQGMKLAALIDAVAPPKE